MMMIRKMPLLQREEKHDMRTSLVRGGCQLVGLSYASFDWNRQSCFLGYSLLYIVCVGNKICAYFEFGGELLRECYLQTFWWIPKMDLWI